MSTRIKEYIDIRDHASLDSLIERLVEIRDGLPENADPELRLRGDDIFGRKLSISYFREQTQEEADCAARYASAPRAEDEGWRDVA